MLNEKQISELVDSFVRVGLRAGMIGATATFGEDHQVALCRHEDGWSLQLAEDGVELEDEVARWDYPLDLPEDELGSAIALASYLSTRLHNYTKGSGPRNYLAKLTPEERSARAKKAVEARIKKYGQKKRKDS